MLGKVCGGAIMKFDVAAPDRFDFAMGEIQVEVRSSSEGNFRFTFLDRAKVVRTQELSLDDIFNMLPRAVAALEGLKNERN